VGLAKARVQRLGYMSRSFAATAPSTGALRCHHRFGRWSASSGSLEAPARAERAARHSCPYQTLIRVRRIDEDGFDEEDFSAVAFVPVIGAEGWPDAGKPEPPNAQDAGSAAGLLMPERRAQSIQTRLTAETALPFGDLDALARPAMRCRGSWFEETGAVTARPDTHPYGPDEIYPFGF
jgi:hypothetical protein